MNGHGYDTYAAQPGGAGPYPHPQQQPMPQPHAQYADYSVSPTSEYNPYASSASAYPPIASVASPYPTAASSPPPGRAYAYSPPPSGGVAYSSGRQPSVSIQSPPNEAASALAQHSIADRATREKDGGRSLAKSSNTTGSRLRDPDALIRVPTKRASGLLITVLVEAIIIITLVCIVFARIFNGVETFVQDLKTVSVYLAIFVFGAVFQVVVAFDAVRLKNTIQAIGVCIFNVALTVAAGLEISQVRDALVAQDQLGGGTPCRFNPRRNCGVADRLYPKSERLLIVVVVVCGVAEIPIIYWTAKLWSEFGWIIYQKIGADLRIRSMFLWYQVYIVMLKFTFFFGVGFTVLYLILVADTTDWEYGVTIAAVPIAIVALFSSAFAVRREVTSVMAISLFLMIAGLVYFVYKLTQVWVPATREQYQYVRLTITFISAFSILSLALTLANGIVCMMNFHKGLRQAHDAIGIFGGVRTHRRRGTSNGNVLDVDQPKESESTAPNSGATGQNQQTATRISLD